MRRNAAILFLLCALCFPHPSPAARFTGDYLLQMCASDEQGKEITPGGHIACQAYIAGVLDYHNLIHSLGTAPSIDFCVPDDVSLDSLQSQVLSYVFRNRYQHGNFIASPAVALSLYARYPCNKAKKK